MRLIVSVAVLCSTCFGGASSKAWAQTQPPTPAPLVMWRADLSHSQAEFSIAHMVISKVAGRVPIQGMYLAMLGDSLIPQKVVAVLDVAHEDTGNASRDSDLQSAAYFDTAHYPTIMFSSTRVIPRDATTFEVIGRLTMKGVTRIINFPVHITGKVPDRLGTRVGYSAELHLDRRDYGINDNRMTPLGVLVVGYDVDVVLTVEATTWRPRVAAPVVRPQ